MQHFHQHMLELSMQIAVSERVKYIKRCNLTVFIHFFTAMVNVDGKYLFIVYWICSVALEIFYIFIQKFETSFLLRVFMNRKVLFF